MVLSRFWLAIFISSIVFIVVSLFTANTPDEIVSVCWNSWNDLKLPKPENAIGSSLRKA